MEGDCAMNKEYIHIVVATLVSIVFSGTLYAQDSAPSPNRIGLNINLMETDEQAYGAIYERDVTARDRLFITIEKYESEENDRTTSPNYMSTFKYTIEGEEIEAGYLRRLSQPGSPFGVFAGVSVGFGFNDGNFESTQTDATGTYLARGDISADTGINLYANIMGEYITKSGVGAFGMFSYGYAFGRDCELKYSTGATTVVEGDSDTFWNLALGGLFAF